MKRNYFTVLALLLACLLVLTACGSKPQGNKPNDPVGGGTEQPGGSGNQPGGSGDPSGGGSGSNEPERIFLGGVSGVEYWMAVYPADPSRNNAVSR